MKTFRRLAAVLGAAALSGCGGGGPDVSPVPTTQYINWVNSANGEIIKDASNENFRVRASDRVVVFDGNGFVLNGTYVDTDANLFINNQRVGVVAYATATNGSQITVFRCLNGRALDFYNTSSTTYAHQCV
ncbi:MAG: hypothetical protein N2483_10110 [Burkholderiaceae bacterium]|nr:hypothetical protein [Burkholderiaceae bacterium]